MTECTAPAIATFRHSAGRGMPTQRAVRQMAAGAKTNNEGKPKGHTGLRKQADPIRNSPLHE